MSPGRGPRPDRSDLDLHAAALTGDRAAMGELLARHETLIFTVCRRLLGNDADAADATQETLIKLVTRLGHFDGRAKFSTWAYRIASNTCLDELRRRKRRPEPGLPGVDVEGREAAGQSRAGPDLVHDRMEIDAALATLPEDFRVPVVLRDLCDLDYATIAETLDLPIGTVRSRISRGRAALAGQLNGANPPTPGNSEGRAGRPTTTGSGGTPPSADLTQAP